MICTRLKAIAALALIFLTLFTIPSDVECANNKKSSPTTPNAHEPTIEEVTAKQLERILADKDYVAVYWCKFRRVWIVMSLFVDPSHFGLSLGKWNSSVKWK